MAILAAIVVLAIPLTVFAATSDTPTAKAVRGFFGIDTSKLTDQQKSELMAIYKSMAELRKDLVNKMVANGLLTKDQGDNATKKIDAMLDNLQTKGLPKVIGMMGGFNGFVGFGIKGVDTSKLTDQQKADLNDYFLKMAGLQKDAVSKLVSYGILTKDQGDALSRKIDNMEKYHEQNGFSNLMQIRKGHLGKGRNQG